MSRLSSLGHELYDRVFHRGDSSRSGVPESTDDTTATLRIVRDDAPPQDLAGVDVDELAYGEDAQTDDTSEASAEADGQNWVESLEEHAAEDGPAPGQEVRPPDDRRHH
jgi:hypothetical protein